MAHDPEDDDRIGRPATVRLSRPGPVIAPLPEPTEPEEPFLRAGDPELGRPVQIPTTARPLTDADRRQLRETEEAQALRDLAEAEELLAADPVAFRWAGWFAHPLAAAFLLGSIGVLGLFLYAQVLSILSQIATQPPLLQYGSYTALGLLAAAVLYSMARLLGLFVRLQRNRQVRLAGLEELQSRTRLRWLALAKTHEAKGQIEDYLRAYPLEGNRVVQARIGLTEATVLELARVREELLDPSRYSASAEWFARFGEGFQARLDAVADERIRYWSNRAMVVTAVSPNGLVDSLSTMYFGFAMVTDLCRVYNLRAGRTGTAVLLGRVFFNAYLSGQINDFEKLAEEHYDHAFEQAFQVIGVGVSSNMASKFLGKVGAKATSGFLNRLLLARLGRYACRLLRPVTRD